MNFDKAYDLAVNFLKANIVFALWGHPGIGKSALGQLLADNFNLEFIDIRLGQIDPVDLNGFVHKDVEHGTFDYLPWARFPLEDTPVPEGKNGWLIMFDEVNTAPRQNLAASYKIFLDRAVGSRKLHKRCRLMMGGNLVGEGLAGALPSPLVSRGAHIVMTPEITPTVKKILGPTISGFLLNHPKFIYQETMEPNTPFPTLRTWEMVSNYEKKVGNASLETLSCIVGNAAAVSYMSYQQQTKNVTGLLAGVEMFPLDKAQDLLDFLSTNVTELDKHLHRFPNEWHTIAKVRSEAIKAAEPTT